MIRNGAQMSSPSAIKPSKSLRFRFTILVSVLVFVITMLGIAFNTVQGVQREIASKRVSLRGTATAYAAALADPLKERDLSGAYAVLRGIRDLPDISHAGVLDDKRVRFAELGAGAVLAQEIGRLEEMSDAKIWNAGQLRIELPVVSNGEEIGWFRMTADISDLKASVIDSIVGTLIAAFLSMIIAILVTQFMVRRLTRPLHRLSQKMTELGEDIQVDLDGFKPRQDETGVLISAFKDMMHGLRERDAEIAENVRTLETKVEERTHDLKLAKDEAEAANAAKSNFLATMSHEIRTPMNGLMVMAEMLSAAELSARHRRYANIIHRSGKSLLTIINDILDLSKIEAGKLELEHLPLSPDLLIADVASLFAERAREKGLELVTIVDPDVPNMIFGDPTRLNQIITNLVNNALKFTKSGGVTIHLGRDPNLNASQSNAFPLVCSVIDTGIGIPKEKIATIFDAFVQADQSTTREFGGTGLGLSVCKRLATAMGGEINITSEVGKGSTFALHVSLEVKTAAAQTQAGQDLEFGLNISGNLLPTALKVSLESYGAAYVGDLLEADVLFATTESVTDIRAENPTLPIICLSDIGETRIDDLLREGVVQDVLSIPVIREDLLATFDRVRRGQYRGIEALGSAKTGRSVSESFDGLCVLAVDDNAVNREVLAEALRTLGAKADFAENGQQAIDMVQAKPYDLIFMDGSMPVMDGFEATRRIRAMEADGQFGEGVLPIFALTAQVHGTTVNDWEAVGANDHISKPFTIERIADALRSLNEDPVVEEDAETVPSETVQDQSDELLDAATLGALDKLSESSGTDMRERVWGLFATKAPEAVSNIRTLVNEDGTHKEIKDAAHALKSMALSSAAGGVARVAEEIERSSKDSSDMTGLMVLVIRLDTAVSMTLETMRQSYPALAA